MPNYILKYNDLTQHYFYIPNQGLCVRSKPNTIWQNYKPVYHDSTDVFSVYCDHNNILHAICINPQNEIIYLIYKNSTWQSCAITQLKNDMEIEKINLFETNIGLSMVYTARHFGETLLIHCVLGNHAMPETIDKISSTDFFIFKKRVYYTNSNGILGYKDLSDGKSEIFNRLTDNGEMPYLITTEEKDMLVYKKNDEIYFQNRPVHKDSNATHPILTTNSNQLLLLWQSGDFIRYITSSDTGNTWSSVMQYVNPGKTSQIYHVICNSKIQNYFGNHSSTSLNIYGKNDIFEAEPPKKTHIPKDPNQITKLKIMIELQKKEIIELKKEILRLGEILKEFSSLTKNNPSSSDIFPE